MNMREAYAEKIKAKLDAWNADINKMEAKANETKADIKVDYKKKIEELKAKQAAAREKLEEVQNTGESAWSDFKTGLESAVDSLGEAVKSAKYRFH